MGNVSLQRKAASGIVWTALQNYSTMFIQFVSGIILARLLTPYDYGCIGMLTVFMVLAEAFIDGGFGSALIQKKRPTQEDYSTIFWWNMIMSFSMYFILFCCAPYIARFYSIPLLSDVLRVQGIILFIYAFNVVQRNQLRKKLDFRVLSIVTIVTSLLALGITIILAYKGCGVWALVVQNIVTSLIPAVVFWFYVKWRPILVFSKDSFRELFGFGFYMFLTHLINSFSQQVQGLLIGKVYSPSTMGYYSKALSTEKLASTSISRVMTQVTYPLYAEVQDDRQSLVGIIKRLTSIIAYVSFPLLFILLLIARPLFVLLYSDVWIQSVPYFRVLCIAGLAVCLQSINLQTISAIGKSNVMFVWTLVKRTVGLFAILSGLFLFGMNGLLVGVVINSWFSFFVNIVLVSKYIGYKWTRQLIDLLPFLVVSILAAVVSYWGGCLFHVNMYVVAVIELIIYSIIYIGWSIVFKPEPYSFLIERIKRVRNNSLKD